MTTLSKSLTAGGVGLGIAGSVTTYQLTKSNSEESKQQVNTDEGNEYADQDNLQSKAKEAPQEGHKAQDKQPAEQPSSPVPTGTSISDIKARFFNIDPNKRPLEKEPIEFKALEGRDRPDWISTSGKERGVCANDNDDKCEWSDFLKAKVPKGEKEKLRNSAINHAHKKCESINGRLSNDPENNQKGWTICTYSEGVESKTTGFYELNLDNEDLYQK
ncbi:hypothetical protein [Candidatus Mycoplasma haematohominis]|uniref:Uncharacterized protein n=1 Tax=Candidatus Mycoplasma haematohominis TaxID=1494318 RepID=A0A478FRJ0_9MOLU|nr:hypothetical protein [Candidatus Mycoplasma haemohominis]GCE63039.1 hypothetical protein MHSWG343_00170 [Candidatus Mycoplasma haemohominis]